ncbi:hypothetical protein GGI15_000117 [Coemansia interrupta]|uniref:PH domain-containing protein n=1 Tax=Coemansia interrupta TaxID=1126814 RepID=A0A9W8HKS4_9FUNG|nr:hypothetical protein GGI15_000117 [Coemansia interrupta]
MDPFNPHSRIDPHGQNGPWRQPSRRRRQQPDPHQPQPQQQQHQHQHHQPGLGYGAVDHDDDHMPLSAISGQPFAFQQQQQQQQHQQPLPMEMAMHQQNYQQQYQQPMFSQHEQYPEPQHHFGQPMDYQHQLELELEQQQQQFQQQFLQQYRLVQEQEQQYQGMGMAQPEWMHEGFVGHHEGPENPYSLGFQSTPHNPNLAAPYAAGMTPQMMDAAAYNYPTSVAGDAVASSSRRHSGRPWVNGSHAKPGKPSKQTQQQQSPQEASDGSCDSDESASSLSSSESSATDSSDESVYRTTTTTTITSKKSAPKTSAKAKVNASRSPSAASSGTPGSADGVGKQSAAQPQKRHPRMQMHIAAASGSYASHASSRSATDSDTDDDVPLSVISSSSTPSIDALAAAAVRRTKTTTPASSASRRHLPASSDENTAVPDAIHRGAAKSRSLNARSGAARRQHVSPIKVPPSVREDAIEPSCEAADNYISSDEDAPLDQLKAELESGARAVPDDPIDIASSLTTSSVAHTIDDRASGFSVAPSASSVIQQADGASASSETGSLNDTTSKVLLPTDETAADAAADGSDSAGRSIKDVQATRKPKTKRSSGYLPKGMALPALPVKQRSSRARAAVQYIALADIVESTERSIDPEADIDAAGDAEAEGFDTGDAFDGAANIRRRKSMRAADGANANGESGGDDCSLHSHFESAPSSSDTIMDALRAGPVELLTASTERSGSKAVLDWVVPEDYGNIDMLLSDLDGIMSGSLAARKRFSLTLMRRSLAVANGLIEPGDFSESHGEFGGFEAEGNAGATLEFKPLDIPDIGASVANESVLGADAGGGNGSTSGGGGGGLGLEEMIMSTLNIDSIDFGPTFGTSSTALDTDDQPLNELAANASAKLANLGNLDSQLELEPLTIPPLKPVELTRSQKVQKALEKLELLDVRKVSIRIYVQDAQRYYTFALTKYTTCEMILNDMKKSGIIDPEKTTWALFELVEHFGIERPLNHFENLMSLVESWEPRSNNFIIVKGFAQQSSLTLLGGVQPGDHAIQGMLYYRIKKSKWQKGVFRLQGHNMIIVKDSRGKSVKESHYLTLTNNDIYTPFEALRGAPTRYVFGLKSEMPMQMFEKPDEDYVKWFAAQTLDGLREWLQVFRLAKNQIKFRKVLESRVVEAGAMKDSEADVAPVNKPLVELAADKHDETDDGQGKKDFAQDLVSSINRIATSSKFDPSALVKVVEQGGVDVSDFRALAPDTGAQTSNDNNADDNADENMFIPGSLLSKPRKTAAETRANQQQDEELFSKGSLLSQPRESKALAASRAMQSVMAQDGNVFTQGSLLQVTEHTKPRLAHVGGAPAISNGQFPLMQMDGDGPDFSKPAVTRNATLPQTNVVPGGGRAPLVSYDTGPIFTGLMAGAHGSAPIQFQHQTRMPQPTTMAGKLGNYH